MEIQGPGGISGPGRIEPQRIAPQRAERAELGAKVGDTAEISEHARLLDQLSEVPDIRLDRVETLREEIAAGEYETPERVAKAVEKLLEEL